MTTLQLVKRRTFALTVATSPVAAAGEHVEPQAVTQSIVVSGGTNDSGYPGTVALTTSQLVTVVYDEARRAAIALRYTVSDVD